MSGKTPRSGAKRAQKRGGEEVVFEPGAGAGGGGNSNLGKMAVALVMIFVVSFVLSQRMLLTSESSNFEQAASLQLTGKDNITALALKLGGPRGTHLRQQQSLHQHQQVHVQEPKDFKHVWKHGAVPVMHTPPAPGGNVNLIPPSDEVFAALTKKREEEKLKFQAEKRAKEAKKKKEEEEKKAKAKKIKENASSALLISPESGGSVNAQAAQQKVEEAAKAARVAQEPKTVAQRPKKVDMKAQQAAEKARQQKQKQTTGPSSGSGSNYGSDTIHLHQHTQGKGAEADKLPYDYHPRMSPRLGSDISSPHAQAEILQCPNQSKCIVPELSLQPKLKVYLCRHPVRQGVRFYFLTREGLLLHPGVSLVPFEDIHTADFAVYLPGSAPWHRTECNDTSLADRLIVMDEFDGHSAFAPAGNPKVHNPNPGPNSNPDPNPNPNPNPNSNYKVLMERYPASRVRTRGQWYFQMFKRSYVVRKRGSFKYYPHLTKPDMYPITYSLAEAYLRGPFTHTRKWDIVCTLRGSRQQPARLRVQEWLKEYVADHKIPEDTVVTGQLNKASRTTVNKHYFELMHSARIIVTVNPSDWEGDFRLWESLASGALVFVDPVFAPHAYPLEHGKHVIFFSNENKTDMWTKLDYYRNPANHAEARRIAISGYLHCMKYHRTVNMIDFVLRTAHTKRALLSRLPGEPKAVPEEVPPYPYTGQYLFWQTKQQQKDIETSKQPGAYPNLPFKSEYAPPVPGSG